MADNKRISLSQLGEYLTASPSRRKSIIEEAAEPKPFIIQTYNRASAAITKDLLSGSPNSEVEINAAISELTAQTTSTIPDWQKQHARNCIEALERYKKLKPSLQMETWEVAPMFGPGHIVCSGVRITVSPEVLVRRLDGNETRIGAIKFHFAKSNKLGQKRADYLGAVMNWYCEQHLSDQGNADHRCSMIVDIPGNVIYTAPRAKVRNRRDIEAACGEIANGWPT